MVYLRTQLLNKLKKKMEKNNELSIRAMDGTELYAIVRDVLK